MAGEDSPLLFEKDLQEYEVFTQEAGRILIISAHLKDQAKDQEKAWADKKRREQTSLLAAVYKQRKEQGMENIIVAGTFNAASFCGSLSPLLRETDLKDIKKHSSFNVDLDEGKDAGYFSLGVYRMGVNIKQRDYMLVSPALFQKIKNCGLNRKGIFPEKKGQWRCYSSVYSEMSQASSHPMLWISI